MSPELVGALLSAGVAVVGPVLVYKINRKSSAVDASQRQIEGIQQDRQDDREQFEKAAARFDQRQSRLESRIEQMEARERMFSDHILQLRWHIAEGMPPPPPPFPPGLLKPFEGQ